MEHLILQFMSRIRGLFRPSKADAEFESEMQMHLEQLVQNFVRQGMRGEEALLAARRQFGNTTLLQQQHREARSFLFLSALFQDLRYGLRMLARSPGFTATAVLTLSLGIGANAAIFTLINAVLMKNLPVADPKTLVRFGDKPDCCVGYGIPDEGDYSLFSTDAYEQFKKNTPEFQELAAMQSGFTYQPVIVRRESNQGAARPQMGEFVSGNYFRAFGLQPRAGRLLSDADDVKGAPVAAVMSYQTWKRDYDSDSSVAGSTFFINTKPVTITGIAPEGFYGDRLTSTPPDFYLPINAMPAVVNASYVMDPAANWLYIIGRTKPGVEPSQLQGKLSALLRQILAPIRTYSTNNNQAELQKVHVVLTPGGAGILDLQEEYASKLRLLMAISGLVLLIACANLANLLVARGTGRKAEMSLRSALGAMRVRIIRQLLTESLLLSGLSGIAGLGVAYGGTRMLLALAFPGSQSIPIHATPSLAVLGFACGLSLFTGVLFGVAPAFISAKADPADALRSGARTISRGASFLQRGLIVFQAALSLVLLVGAGLFSQSLNKLKGTDLKLESKNRYIVHIDPQAAGYSQRQVGDLYRVIEDRFHAIPGVLKAGISSYTPMEARNDGWSVQVQGQPDLNVHASDVKVNAEYFDSVGTHVVMGRGIGVEDAPTSTTVAVVNQSFVKNLFKPGENPIGHHFGTGPRSAGDYEIVGVVEDTAYTSARWKDHAMYFLSILQRPLSAKEPIERDNTLYAGALVLKTDRAIDEMEALTRRSLTSINPNLTEVKFETLDAQIADQFGQDRMLAHLTALFGALALLLAAVGLYGVTAYTVAQRTPEIGVRMALGAPRIQVTAMVVKGALAQAAIGLLIGIPVALLCSRFVEAQLYEVKGTDTAVLLTSVLTLGAAALVAGLIPARRAASIQPARALRSE